MISASYGPETLSNSPIASINAEDWTRGPKDAVVQIIDRNNPDKLPPTIHPVYWPTFDIKAGDEVTFKVRSFRIGREEGREVWDFGDGSPPVKVQSDGNAEVHAEDGYAVTTHRYRRPGHYLVSVQRSNDRGEKATAHLHVRVGPR